jgi:hypothetical protein
MKHATLVAFVGIAALTAASGTAEAQTVQLSIQNGRVTLQAEQASVRQILAEWERIGQVRVVGVERLQSAQPVTISLKDVPERQALDIVLRSVPGYLAVDRSASAAGVSRYDRLVLLPRVTAVASASPVAQAPAAAQAYTPPPEPQAGVAGNDADQFADADGDAPEPPMPGSPVINPYPAGAAAGGNTGNVLGAGGGATVGVQPPETQFDYANPRAYFERMRQQQGQQQQTQPQARPGMPATNPNANTPALFPGSYTSTPPPATATPNVPTATPTAPGTLARPGIAPTPAQQAPPQGQFFNPYNLPPGYVPPTTTPPPTSNVEPDRAKYANPYVPTKPPQL